MNRPNPKRASLLAALLILCVCRAAGQTPPLRYPTDAQKPPAPLNSNVPVVRKGLFTIDVDVTDAAGKPVADLEPWDFTLLDNGQPAKIRTFTDSSAASEQPTELIFVVDSLNLTPQQLTLTEGAVVHFLLQNNGRLEDPCFLYRLTRDGLMSSAMPTRDGNLLAKEVQQHKSPRMLWKSGGNRDLLSFGAWGGRQQRNSLGSWEAGLERNSPSVHALGAISIDQREIAWRKVVIWIGPGWPVLRGGDNDFDEFTELWTRLRDARITLENVTVWPNPEAAGMRFNYRDYLEAPRSQKDMSPQRMALPVLATQTGGLVVDSSDNVNQKAYEQFLDADIERTVAEARSVYTLTFNPPHTEQMDDYHNLHVEVDRPGLTVRAPTGYYNEPVYFDSPRPRIEKVTVAQLEELVHAQSDLGRKLANLELTERLSTPRLDALLSLIHSERERHALTTDADLSLALSPPADEVVNRPPPPLEEQRAIFGRTFDYLRDVIPKLPDFYALRNTVRYEETAERDDENWKMPHQDQTLHFAAGEHATVLYRNGNEVVDKKQKLGKRRVAAGLRSRDLETWGTFGPILAYVLTAAAASPDSIRWKRWERGPNGDVAVFSYSVPSRSSVHEISYCCLPEGDGNTLYQSKTDASGEFALNPETGAVMRVMINADLDEEQDPEAPLVRSQIMVEYGPEVLGGKTYTCPRRSVEVSRGRSERVLREWGMQFILYGYFETMINDVTFGGYHKFGSESRILTGFEEPEETKTPAPPEKVQPAKAQTAIEEPGRPPQATVAQLTEIVGKMKGADDSEAAKEIEHLQLAERLSTPKLNILSAELPGKKSKAALMIVADASVFLEPPAGEMPVNPAPDEAEQNRILSLAMDYLKKMVPKLPDFYARRSTTSFAETWSPKHESDIRIPGALHAAGRFTATVYYRNGEEVVHEQGAEQHGLITRGTFGPILSIPIHDAAHMQWSRWEQGLNGPIAVLQFDVPEAESHYSISGAGELGVFGIVGPTAYHGEIGIDPGSGAILRLVLEADPGLGSPTERADVMVEYGSVEIGGKTYTCPVRSVSYSMNKLSVPSELGVWKREAIRLNDVVFGGYHKFGSESRILTGFDPAP